MNVPVRQILKNVIISQPNRGTAEIAILTKDILKVALHGFLNPWLWAMLMKSGQ